MGVGMDRKYKNKKGGFFYFDGPWDVIKQGTAKEYSEAFDQHIKGNRKLSSLAGGSSNRFLPEFKDVSPSHTSQRELFRNKVNYACHLNDFEIESVAEAMVGLRARGSDHLQPAGYTYFAQLLTHDIVSSTSLLRTRNASSALNLDSIYFDYDQVLGWEAVDALGRFVICGDGADFYRTKWGAEELRKEKYDIPPSRTEPYYFAVIPDHRNDDNVILSQLHVLLLKLHNQVVELLVGEVIKRKGDREKVSGREYYEHARDLVVLIFQQVTVSDLLNRTLDQDTFDYYFSQYGPSLFPDLESGGIIPKEFTHAVSRYAHSMIRSHYFFNEHNQYQISTAKLFKKNTPLKSDKENLIIYDWRSFFSMPWQSYDGVKNRANKIELSAASLPGSTGSQQTQSIPAKNLATFDITASSQLVTYSNVLQSEAIQNFLENVKGIEPDSYFKKIDYSDINDALSRLNADISLDNSNAPFLVSMYLESSAMPQKHNHDRLGVIGSIVYAETIRMSIVQAEVNYMQNEIDLRRSLMWTYPVYQSILNSLDSITMIGLSNFITSTKRGHYDSTGIY